MQMKNLLLMRHAKSSWKDDSLEDFERPLKKRGKKDAKRIAKVIHKNKLSPDLILSSSAVRARETVEIIAAALDYDQKIIFSDELYMAEPQTFLDILSTLSDDYSTVMIVGHNPGMEAYLQIVDGEIEALPTAGLGHLVLALDKWEDISIDTMGELVGFWTPKALKEED
jgi:phosphohistidine phosphatase